MKQYDFPLAMEVKITNKCNLRCKYCSHYGSPSDVAKERGAFVWLDFFKKCKKNGLEKITLSGGEPFLREDIDDIILGLSSLKICYNILSNGTLINRSIAKRLKETGYCNKVQVSIDGADENTHDSFCGHGSFNRAIKGIEVLQNEGINVGVRVTIHRNNVYKLEDIAAFILDKLQVRILSTNAASYLGTCKDYSSEVQLSTSERYIAMKTLKYLKGIYAERITANAGPHADMKIWGQMEYLRANNIPPEHYGGFLTGCTCAFSAISARPDGILVPCALLSHLELGDISECNLKKLWVENGTLKKLRQRMEIPLVNFDYCRDCCYITYCTGSCPGLSYTILGKINHPNPSDCLRSYLDSGGSLDGIIE